MSRARTRVSVIVVCWNSADVLERCLEHLLAQDYPDYEIIVVDDGSQDETVEVAERSLSSGRVTVVRSPLNRGCPAARNLGMRHAQGEVIAFIDADGYAHPGWLAALVSVFEGDPSVGGVASTVFLDRNPLVLNGAGGTTNRQGWAADLCMNVPFDEADIPGEALYPMGCGMAVRREAAERVGSFDSRMLNYYDDVDYGVRLWRAGYRVVVARDAWIDHGFGHSTKGDSPQKQLLCEQHRMRVVLTHAPIETLPRWLLNEALAWRHAMWPRRALKVQALRWNALNVVSTTRNRFRLRRQPPAPRRLYDRSWSESFPVGVPPLVTPRPERALSRIDMAEGDVSSRLPYGWYPPERVDGRMYGWAGPRASVLLSVNATARRLRIELAHAPEDTGGVRLSLLRLGDPSGPRPVWSTSLRWQYLARTVENHPVDLPEGDYEAVFSTARPWSDPPRELRPLGFALARLALEERFEVPDGGLNMRSTVADDQLITGWFDLEGDNELCFRWAGGHAEALVRTDAHATRARLSYCLPPAPTGGLRLSLRPSWSRREVWSAHLPWVDGSWHEAFLPTSLSPGDYVVSFETARPWSNLDGTYPMLWPEARTLGCAVAALELERARTETRAA